MSDLYPEPEPHKCPKCNGFGYLQYNPSMPFSGCSTSLGPWKCDVCNNGVLWTGKTVKGESDGKVVMLKRKNPDTVVTKILVYTCDKCGPDMATDLFTLQCDGYIHCAVCAQPMLNLTVVEDEP